MLIKDKDYLMGTTYKGDKFTMHHVQPTLNIQEEAYNAREFSDNGWTKGKTMRHIAHIPALDAARLAAERPGFFTCDEMMSEWLKREGEVYLTVKKNTIK